jgi:hypothetical protein
LGDEVLCGGFVHEEATIRGVWPTRAHER